MMKYIALAMMMTATAVAAQAAEVNKDEKEVNLTIVQTTDVHGNYFPYDFINRRPSDGSMARVATYVKALRDSLGSDNLILLDNGDILQGQPAVYYYNFIDTVTPHLTARILNYLGYDAETIGNHDVETGHKVYDRYRSQLSMPLLGANVIDKSTGKPYLTPYIIIERDGVKIAVLGLLTPAIPAWLPETLWDGLDFEDMVSSARRWVPEIREKHNPDLVIGLFHSGRDAAKTTGKYRENASLLVAREVPGLDAVLFGHDHTRYDSTLENVAGETVMTLNPANNATSVAQLDIKVKKADGKVVDKQIDGRIVDVTALEPDEAFMAEFMADNEAINAFVDRKLGTATGDFSVRDAYFGPSAFIDLIHDLQLEISGADISFAAPLTFDAIIKEGDVTVSDMFKLYKYENMLYTMELTGREIKDYLEKSYALWTSQMSSPDDHLLLLADGDAAKGDYAKLKNPSYNFDSAAGIDYTVDVTKPEGQKITILGMSDGRKFDPDAKYKVAVNSYRGNGGGDLLTKGAGIPAEELPKRIISSTDKDLRYYLIKAVEQRGTITPGVKGNWHFVPEALVAPAAERDRKILF
ncbi:MAG: bifunctional metallophosphatase/5'-nucleotidase [Lachnoclostridium sp.]|nr:bifunctional metallophosphatase/5'-nucleotidase [Lachnoclostridium sp.]